MWSYDEIFVVILWLSVSLMVRSVFSNVRFPNGIRFFAVTFENCFLQGPKFTEKVNKREILHSFPRFVAWWFRFCKRDTTFSSNEIIVEKMSFLRKMQKEKTASEKEVDQANKIVNDDSHEIGGCFAFGVFFYCILSLAQISAHLIFMLFAQDILKVKFINFSYRTARIIFKFRPWCN